MSLIPSNFLLLVGGSFLLKINRVYFQYSYMQQSPIFEHLKVMVIDDMIYLIHVKGLAEYVRSSLSLEAQLHFVDLEQDPPKVGSCCRVHVS